MTLIKTIFRRSKQICPNTPEVIPYLWSIQLTSLSQAKHLALNGY